jgi:general stress protein 26
MSSQDSSTTEREPITTTLDARFSDANVIATEWASTRRALETAELSWITTVRADGRPHVTPTVAVWLDGAIHFSTGPHEQKALNLRANPTVVVTTGGNAWRGGLDVVVEGVAVRQTDAELLRRLAEAWKSKWDGRWRYESRDGVFHQERGSGHALVFTVQPTTIFAFGRNPFTQTRHRFPCPTH